MLLCHFHIILSVSVTSLLMTLSNCTTLTSVDLTGWNTSNVVSFDSFFANNTYLTTISGLSSLNTSGVTTFNRAFRNCSTLSGVSIHDWDITSATTLNQLFEGANNAISNSEYDAILIAWAAQSTPKNNVPAHFGDAKYSAGDAATARGVLTGTYGWTITDGGQV